MHQQKNDCMRLLILLFALFLQSVIVQAQKNLSRALQHAPLTKIYKINDVEARKLTRRNLYDFRENYLHTLVDSFPTLEKVPSLPAGNYLLVFADRNKLKYRLHTVGDLQADFISNHRDISVLIHDKEGRAISDANVVVGRKRLMFNDSTGAYGPVLSKRYTTAHVVYQNSYYSFPLKVTRLHRTNGRLMGHIKSVFGPRQRYYRSYFEQPTRYEKKFKGFLTFSKPKYRPGDTVRVKAFVETNNGRFLKRPLILRLTDRNFTTDTILSTVRAYRAGAYLYEFVLNDSLDLSLDDNYLVTFEEERSKKYDVNEYDGDLDDEDYAMKRKVVMRGKFYYEEYELNQVTFTARTDKQAHSRNIEASVFVKALDKNNLPVLDGRVEIILLTNKSDNIRYDEPTMFIPDTLWRRSQMLETIGETKIAIPDSVFPHASFDYRVQCNFRNANNELHTERLTQHFCDERKIVDFVQDNDSLFIRYFNSGQEEPLTGDFYIYDKSGDTIARHAIRLPTHVKIRAFDSRVEFIAGDVVGSFTVQQKNQLVDCSFDRTPDSVYIDIRNCCTIKTWYTIFAGNKVVRRGYADSVAFHERSITKKNYFISLQYFFGGRFYESNYSVPFQNKSLNVQVNQPNHIDPGQTSRIEIAVSDSKGRPVPDADVTAFALTGKFEATAPVVPYLGKIYPYRRPLFNAIAEQKGKIENDSYLNWARWSHEFHLDTMEYYHFLYPESIYLNTEDAPDNITQIAPFVVSMGEVQPIQFLYIDEVPVFFLQSQDVSRYSFEVSEGKHAIRMRTPNKMISVDSVFVEKGKKTFFSVNADAVFPGVTISKMPWKMTDQELDLWRKYMIVVENTFKTNYAYIQQDRKVFLLNKMGSTKWNTLVGPLKNADASFVVKGRFVQSFQPEGLWHYNITKGLVKQKWFDKKIPFSRYVAGSSSYNFGDYVMTVKEVDSLWQDYIDHRRSNDNLFASRDWPGDNRGRLVIGYSHSLNVDSAFVKNVILFRKDNPDFVRVYAGQTKDLGVNLAGQYRVFVLLKDGRYYLVDEARVKPNGINYYLADADYEHPRDNVSDSIRQIIESRIIFSGTSDIDLDNIKKTFNDKYFDSSLLTDFISGVVMSDKREPVPGASVYLKGTSYGTGTTNNGAFGMKVPPHGTLVVAGVGYETQELPLQTSTSYYIVLKEQQNNLQEVVVTALGVSRKKHSISYFNTFAENLSGAVPGVQIRIRGAASRPDGFVDFAKITAPKIAGDNETDIFTGSMRRNFRDDAYWQPRLTTDASGKTSFIATFPDDITNWNTHVIAMAGNRRTGAHNGTIRAYRTVSGNIALPMFAIAGDSMNVIGKALNYLSEGVQLNRRFWVNDELQNEKPISFSNSWIDTFMLVVPTTDSLKLKYVVARNDGYYDGEERKIPVFKPGTLETDGIFAALNGDTSIQCAFSSDTGTIKIYAEASLLPVLEKEAEHIRNYEYLCNEQLASKLKAMLALKKVRKYLGRPFDGEGDISTLIRKLNQNRHSSGLWGWWPGNEPSLWISLHAIEAQLDAEKAGYSVYLDKQVLGDYLIYNMESTAGNDKLTSLEILARLHSKANLKKYVDSLGADPRLTTFYDQLRLVRLQQQLGMRITIDTLIAKSSTTAFGNHYWGSDNYEFFDNSVQNTLQMYHILKNAGGYESMLRGIRNYFLEKRKSGYWRNTYESSLILETILPDILAENSGRNSASLALKFGNDSIEISRFPFSVDVKNLRNVEVKKAGTLPVYFTAYQQYWNLIPTKVAGNFDVQTMFQKNGRVSLLKAGLPVTMLVKVEVKRDADYVMIEVPIPAGCSYGNKEQSFANNEVHREYFRNKVSIFCSSLMKGKYEFKVELLPRYTGVYTLNPAKAEMMYFPIFNGREEIRKVTIQPGDL
jgi:hypothetical protein